MKNFLVLVSFLIAVQPSLACRKKCGGQACAPQPRMSAEASGRIDYLKDALPEPTLSVQEVALQIAEFKRLKSIWKNQELGPQSDEDDSDRSSLQSSEVSVESENNELLSERILTSLPQIISKYNEVFQNNRIDDQNIKELGNLKRIADLLSFELKSPFESVYEALYGIYQPN